MTIQVRDAREDDRRAVLDLLADVFGAAQAAGIDSLWDWRWRSDPRLEPPGPRGTVASWRGEILGHIGFVPAGLFVAGVPVEAWWAVDAAVSRGRLRRAIRAGERKRPRGGSREAGVADRMVDHSFRHAIVLGKGTGTTMANVARRRGFVEVGRGGFWVRRVSIIPRARRVLGGPLARAIGGVVEGLRDRIPASTIEEDRDWPPTGPSPAAFETRAVVEIPNASFDASFDALWDDARRTYGAITRRDASMLAWRYRERPGAAYTILALRNHRLLHGYAVLRAHDAGRHRHGRILDLLTRADDDAARDALLAACLRRLRRDGVEQVRCYATHSILIGALRRAGFRPGRSHEPLLARGWRGPEPYVTEGDGDGD